MSIFDYALEKEMQIFEKTYDCLMDVYRNTKKEKENGKTRFSDELIYEQEKCALSRENKSENTQTDSTNNISYTEILFLSPDIKIEQGDTIIVTTKNKEKIKYKSGVPEWFSSHQEIILEREDRA